MDMATVRTPRSAWIEEGLRALAGGGPEAVRVESLARDLGVTKGGFYWHFDGREALLSEMLDQWERVMVDEVIERVDGVGGDARTRLKSLFELASSVGPRLKVELAIRDWARRDKAIARRLRNADNRRMDYLRSLYAELCPDEAEVEARSLLTMALFTGNHFIAADHGKRSRAEALSLATKHLLA